MKEQTNWYVTADASRIDTPALLLFPARIRKNIATAIAMTGGPSRLRPHVKTHKSPDVTRLFLEAGVDKFKCATIAEADMLGMCGAKDVLLAYQPLGPKLARFIALIQHYPATSFSCLVDNPAAVEEMSAAFTKAGITVPVYIDLNTGMNRSGIAPGDAALKLYLSLSKYEGIHPAGLHAYDGHIRHADVAEREKLCNAAFATVTALRDQVKAKGAEVPVIIAGGSPTFPIHAKRTEVECSPGTFVYWDKGYSDSCPEQDFLPAAVVMTRIVSIPADGIVCADLGHKSISAENEITKRVHLFDAAALQPIGHSEEHLVLKTEAKHQLKTGDIFYGIPFHVCPTIALYERAYTIEEGKLTGEWKTMARDRKINF